MHEEKLERLQRQETAAMGTFSHHHTQWASLPVGHNTENKPEATTRANGVPKGKNNAEGCPKE